MDEFCEDEGCPHHGIAHVCVSKEPFWGGPEHERKRMLDKIDALTKERDALLRNINDLTSRRDRAN